ncbi:aldehyde dehydrogenase family protein [Paenibacillus sp. LHD-117]|uniref:aldehyde dehydrogenase family protein n=1 Tax=Paenibacillus sp. LHD-117 TaxID=3071412 RepID=UPI0027DF01AE|nr:aldehyde dehydrogenase family protein [Paenibacillus sp. LHD-117]MDQ6422045.1 aldehyde dehydrogenase family protein [Paenibacillus sp. LHD-117]
MLRKSLWIDGQWREPAHYVQLRSPHSNEMIAEVPAATIEETNDAIASAYGARSLMRAMPAHERAAILERVAALLHGRREEAARLIALEAAKPLKYARAEVDRTVQTYKFAAEEAKRLYGETIPLDAAPGGEGRLAYTVREPLGVIGAITPFNFPMNLVAHKVGPAVAAGNTVVLKPAGQTPLSAFMIAELFHEGGLPPGALNVVTGAGSIVGGGIVEDDRISMVTFTGSPEVGKSRRERAGLKRVTLELGSNAALIVDRDVELERIIPRCVTGAFSNQGQVCISLQRIYVHEAIFDDFVRRFCHAAEQLKVGDPLEPDTDVSAMIAVSETERALAWVREAAEGGAKIVTGGKLSGGALAPTVLTDAAAHMKVSCMELFAPVAMIGKVSGLEEAIALVNDSKYGLQAGIYTNDIGKALQAADELHVGGVMINDIPTFRVDHMPYGGVKESGTGREGVKYAVQEMTELKLVVVNRSI